MGIKGLLTWVKNTYPELSKPHPDRWKSAGIRGKRVALDGTLLTHRFHLGDKARDGRTNAAVRGWYSLIRQLRNQRIKPIAIWDERGERAWKAPEARRRLEARALHMARLLHEERRQMRIHQLRHELTTFSAMTPVEQTAISAWWTANNSSSSSSSNEETSSGVDQAPAPVEEQDAAEQPQVPISPVQFTPATIASAIVTTRFSIHLYRLMRIVEAYQFDSNPELHEGPQDTLLEAFDHEENYIASLTRETSTSANEDEMAANSEDVKSDEVIVATALSLSEPSNVSVLDARLLSLEPATVYRETPRQQEMSELEGRVYKLAFEERVDSSMSNGIDCDLPISEGSEAEQCFFLEEAFELLDTVDENLPRLFGIYETALNIPLEEDHEKCRELLRRMGVPIIWAKIPYEAEGLASSLVTAGLVDFVGTEDSDVLAYGGRLLRNVSDTSKPLILTDATQLREATGLDGPAYRDFCVLLGTDASPRIPGVGPVKAFRLIKEHGSIEAILAANPTLVERLPGEDGAAESEFMRLVTNSRTLFDGKPSVPADVGPLNGTWLDDSAVRKWLYDEFRIVARANGYFDGYAVDVLSEEEVAHAVSPQGVGQERPTVWDVDWGMSIHDPVAEGEAAVPIDMDQIVPVAPWSVTPPTHPAP